MEKVRNVERIFEFCRILNHRADIGKYVETPLIPICEYLFDLNIQTTMSNANAKNGKDKAYIIINYDTLSSYNKNVLDKLMRENPSNFKVAKFSVVGENQEMQISIPITEDTNVQTIVAFFEQMLKDLKMQDIDSFMDGETGMKNIYSLNEFISYYIMLNRGASAESKTFEISEEIENFLVDIGFKKIPSSEFYKGRLKVICDYIYKYHTELWFTDKMIYDVILRKKEKMFKSENISLQNINIDELIETINKKAKRLYNEEFSFNPKDKRFYLNDELLRKHEDYIKEKEYEGGR